jgi:HEAT repeat protein
MARAPADERWPMAYALAQIAPPSDACCQALESALDAQDPDIRWAVVVLLARLARAPAAPILSRLVELSTRGTATQRRMALYALRDCGASDARAPQALRAGLGDADPLVRVAALTSLKIFPEAGRAAVDEILRVLENDPDVRVRASAALALAHSGAPDAAIRPALERAAASGDATVAKAARAALEILKKKS